MLELALLSSGLLTAVPCEVVGSITVCPDRVSTDAGVYSQSGDSVRSTFAQPEALLRLGRASLGPVTLETGAPIVDATWRLALQDIATLRRSDQIRGKTANRFNAGESWAQAWTRDTAYSTDLGLVFVFPDEMRAGLDASLQRLPSGQPVALQDRCGHFGGWPNLTDAIVWALGRSEWRKAQGGHPGLDYRIIAASLARAEAEAFDPADGLFRGVASFMESHSGYPPRFRSPDGPANKLIGRTKALSTNVLYLEGYQVAASMAESLGSGELASLHRQKAEALARAIHAAFWRPDAKSYGYFIDETGKLDDRWEGLGSFLACRVGLEKSCTQVLATEPRTPLGAPCLWPQYEHWLDAERRWDQRHTEHHYHDGMVWPFVEGYAGWMAARAGDSDRLERALAHLTFLAGQDLTHREFHHPTTGRGGGSRSQLWSAAGYVGLILRGVLGLELLDDALTVTPDVPHFLGGRITVKGLKYRQATVDITVLGTGRQVASVRLNGQAVPTSKLPASVVGPQTLEIQLR